MSNFHENTSKAMTMLDADLEATGWDLPPRLYFLMTEEKYPDEPYMRLAGVMPSIPTQDIPHAYEHGFRAPEDACGLVLAHEVVRHLTFEEVVERNPKMLEKINEAIVREKGEGEYTEQQIRDFYYESMVPGLPAPSTLPALMRAELRVTCTVMKDGTQMILARTRDLDDPSLEIYPADRLGEQTIPSMLYQFLHGVRPVECDNPVQVVEDMKTLEAISSLPPAEG